MGVKYKKMKITSIKTGRYGERPLSRVRLFIHHQGEDVLTNLDKLQSRPSQVYREKVLRKVFNKLKIEPYNDIVWSKKAGCSCGCSPGFILGIVPHCVGYEAIYVTVK